MRLTLLIGAILILSTAQPLNSVTANEISVSESIGGYTAGCIRNSTPLSFNGEGFQVIRPGRGRYYANPETIEYIETLSAKVKNELGGILLIADISQKTGGPVPDDHSSHQIGLDADILLWQYPVAKERKLTAAEREVINPQSVLTADETAVDDLKWDEIDDDILRLAASDPRVDRIFINPIIKKKLCRDYPGAGWLGKLRPWYGHDGHFHVRLKCPEGNSLCVSQEPIETAGNGCGSDLNTWFRADGTIKTQKSGSSTQKKLPPECAQIMNGNY